MPNTKDSDFLEVIAASVTKKVMDLLMADENKELWPRYMSYETASRYLDKGESTIRRWVAEGILPAVELKTLKHQKKEPVFIDRIQLDNLFSTKN